MHTSCRTQLNLHRISRGNICSDTDGDVIVNVGNILKIEGKIVIKQYSHSSSDQERIEQTEQRERERRGKGRRIEDGKRTENETRNDPAEAKKFGAVKISKYISYTSS